MQSDLDRFLSLVERELGAEDVRVVDAGQQAVDDPCELRCRISDGRSIGVRFASPPVDAEVSQRRLEMLAGTFDAVVAVAEETVPPRLRSRPPVVAALHDELAALCERAAAANAIVIDANSPVEWGAARPQRAIPLTPRASNAPLADGAASADDVPDPESSAALLSRRALHAVRNLSELAALRKGKHVRHLEGGGDAPFIVHSFAGIYLLVLVYNGPFDELRTERAIVEALPRIERLVLALPPLDPSPHADVVAIRRSRGR